MRFDKFTLRVQEALQVALNLASQQGHQGIEAEHLLLALIDQPEGIVEANSRRRWANSTVSKVRGWVNRALCRA
jgi:ATP-dependent Clp protease ATP-binding subunit ClpA